MSKIEIENPKIYNVEINHKGTEHKIQVPENRKILEVAKESVDELNDGLPNLCLAGVCTTCAAKIIEGEVDQSEGMGVSKELQNEGYALLCVSYPRSDLKIETEKEDEVYQRQFGNPA